MFTEQQVLQAFQKVKETYDFVHMLKNEQLQVICQLVNGINAFVVLPTGFGKTDIFVLSPLILDQLVPASKHFALVVVPLLSLMADMTIKYHRKGVPVVTVTAQSKMTQSDKKGLFVAII